LTCRTGPTCGISSASFARAARRSSTTHYLEEADQRSDRLAIVDHGRIIADGAPAELKERYSGAAIAITPILPVSSLPSLARDLGGEAFRP
jgi:hypothetical protein